MNEGIVKLRALCLVLFFVVSYSLVAQRAPVAINGSVFDLKGRSLSVGINSNGSYSVMVLGIPGTVLRSDVETNVDSKLLRSSEYPQHKTIQSEFQDQFGPGSELTVTHTGLQGMPDLVCIFRLYRDQPWGEIQVKVLNTTDRVITVQSIRSLHSTDAPVVNLNGPPSADRILSDSFSEDTPQLVIRELADGPEGMHRATGSQLIYNRQSGKSLFLGALTSDRLLTIFHLKEKTVGGNTQILSYDAVATGTTEILKTESLKDSPASEQVSLSLPVNQGDSLSSERLMFAVGNDYHAQLEEYGHAIRLLHNARVNAPTSMGWWSWTAYYFGLNQGAAVTNMEWLSDNLKQLGYNCFFIDEGYQYARGEYSTPDAHLFPRGMEYIGDQVRHNGLNFGIWTAPFEVSERAWVFQNHKDWLLHNAAGELIYIGQVDDQKDARYVLDATNPGAQEYMRQTYKTLYNWGIRLIKLDFMDAAAVEGVHYRPNTTALEAQRVGLQIIRDTVGEDVLLDKDGSPMLNPVGIVDIGRISQDTGHTFGASKEAATGIAARYYMNRNYFVADPDAFTVSTQVVGDRTWHNTPYPLTFNEAKVSIALSAVSGGQFEIGDDLPTLGASPERVVLVKNADLLDMARLGRSSTPIDLMTYAPSDEQPSVFLLKEDKRQSILTVFNWTDGEVKRSLTLASFGLKDPSEYKISEVFGEQNCCNTSAHAINLIQKPHSVRMYKLIDNALPATPPAFEVHSAPAAKSGESLTFTAVQSSADAPVLTCHWDFGDGTTLDGMEVHHSYTRAGEYVVHAATTGLDASTSSVTLKVSISGVISARFVPANNTRFE
jgi:hypothetical protein